MVSVLMLTYNRENLIRRAIDCVLAQTYRDYEFIIVDNGSTDNSGMIAEEYAEKDKRICVVHRSKGTISAGRNTALDAARGDHIAFIDDDDRCEPDFLEFLLELIDENGADMSIRGAADKMFEEKKIMTAEESLVELMWRRKYNVAFPTKMFRRELIEKFRFPENSVYDDIALMYKIIAESKITAYHGLPKYTFYRHEGNNSAWTTDHSLLDSKTLDEYLTCYRDRTEWLSEKFPERKMTWKYFEWSFMISMTEKISRLKLSDCGRQLEAMKKELCENREHFLNSAEILSFEREWMDKYV